MILIVMFLFFIVENTERELVERKLKLEEIEDTYFVEFQPVGGKIELSIFLSAIVDAGMKIHHVGVVDDEENLIHTDNYPNKLLTVLETFFGIRNTD